MSDERYTRNEGLFGKDGQRRIGETTVGIVGYGGLGSIVGTLLAYLGVVRFRIIEFDLVEWSNLNRLFGASPADLGIPKASIAARSIRAVQEAADVTVAEVPFSDALAKTALTDVDVVIGCVDHDSVRVEILGWATERGIPYIDASSDVVAQEDGTLIYGGRVVVNIGDGCLLCLDQLDQRELAIATMTSQQREDHARIYGIDVNALDESGPSVVSINSVVASLAVTEFMVLVTGLRKPARALTYRADRGGVTIDRSAPRPGCLYCTRYLDRTIDE